MITALAPSQATASQAALDTAQTGEKRTREDGGEADESAKKAKKGDAADVSPTCLYALLTEIHYT